MTMLPTIVNLPTNSYSVIALFSTILSFHTITDSTAMVPKFRNSDIKNEYENVILSKLTLHFMSIGVGRTHQSS